MLPGGLELLVSVIPAPVRRSLPPVVKDMIERVPRHALDSPSIHGYVEV
jgi:hypothetical protein